MTNNLFPILVAGLLGGFGTIFGKLAFSGDNLPINEISKMCKGYSEIAQVNCETGVMVVRIIAFGFMLASNALVVGYFLRAIETNNTVVVIVISSATNFLTSGIFGQLMFGEIVGKTWYLGSLFIVIGMLLVSYSQGTNDKVFELTPKSSAKIASSADIQKLSGKSDPSNKEAKRLSVATAVSGSREE
jgi:drug/metabolite transporter (DMT)-like permease